MAIHHVRALLICTIVAVFCICAMATVSPYDGGGEAAEVSMLQKSYHLLGGNTPLQDDELKWNTHTHTRKPVIWIHIHKNAGTTMCVLAGKNNENIPQLSFKGATMSTNCMWASRDQFYLLNQSWHTSCAARRHAFATHQWTFGMIEREIHEDDICEGFMYAVLLREPVRHVVSMANFEELDIARDLECIRTGALPCDGQTFSTSPTPPVHTWITFDNYQIRTLLGEDGLKIPPGQVTEEHARQVIAMLSKFDLVSFVEELGDATPRMLSDTLGWNTTSIPHFKSGSSRSEQPISDQDLAYIEELNKMDRFVFDYFQQVPIEERGR